MKKKGTAKEKEKGGGEAEPAMNDLLGDILDDLCARFIVNLSEEHLRQSERVCFQLEQAHWFYEDFYVEKYPSLPHFSKPAPFFGAMVRRCPTIRHLLAGGRTPMQLYASFVKYKVRVPVCGAVLLTDGGRRCLLVKGWHAKSSWSFPKGKINRDETEAECTVREVYEETGYVIPSERLRDDASIALRVNQQTVKLFVVPHVPADFPFATRTRKEISAIEWKPVDLLKREIGTRGSHYFLVAPVLAHLDSIVRLLYGGGGGSAAGSAEAGPVVMDVPVGDGPGEEGMMSFEEFLASMDAEEHRTVEPPPVLSILSSSSSVSSVATHANRTKAAVPALLSFQIDYRALDATIYSVLSQNSIRS
jgi:mRNA-decapping enzyme subunit 2